MWLNVTIFSSGAIPSLFHYFRWFKMKAVTAYHAIIQKMEELLFKGSIEPSSGGAGFCSNAFVVPKNTGCLVTIFSLISTCTYTFLIYLQSDRYGNLFKVILLFVLISKMLVCLFLLLSIIINLYILFGKTNLSGRFCHLGHSLWGFYLTGEPILFLFQYKGFHIIIWLDDILVLHCFKHMGRGV